MKKQLTHIDPLKAGTILGILYGIMALIFMPFVLIATLLGNKTGSPAPAIFGAGFAIMLPVIYAVVGFIGGLIMALLYNLVAKWTGGFVFEVRELEPAA